MIYVTIVSAISVYLFDKEIALSTKRPLIVAVVFAAFNMLESTYGRFE